jgi:hypothetical protein
MSVLENLSTIANSINVHFMDHVNMASIIYHYSVPTILMTEWKDYCSRHSITDLTNDSEIALINAIKYHDSEEYEDILRWVEIRPFIGELSIECKTYLLPYLLEGYDFKYFRPTLIYSVNDSEVEDGIYLTYQDEERFDDGFDHQHNFEDEDFYPDEDFYNRSLLLSIIRDILVSITNSRYADGLPLLLKVLEECPSFNQLDKNYYIRAIHKTNEIFEEEVAYDSMEVILMDEEMEEDEAEHINHVLTQAQLYLQQ